MPFFVLANPRSGSSMFRLMLNAHSKITVPPESGFALWYAEKYANVDIFAQDVYERFIDDVLRARKFETWSLTREQLTEAVNEIRPTCYSQLVDAVYNCYAVAKGKQVRKFGDKNNYFVEHIPELINYFPNEKLVLLVRDGRDIAVSYRKIDANKIDSAYTPKLPQDVEIIAQQWKKNVDAFLGLLEKNKNSILVRYEDLLSQPKDELIRVFDFLGEEFEEQTLSFNEFNDEPAEFLQWKSKTLEKIDKNNMNNYVSDLSREEVEKFNSIAKDQLLSLGYDC